MVGKVPRYVWVIEDASSLLPGAAWFYAQTAKAILEVELSYT